MDKTGKDAACADLVRPRTPDELHAWLVDYLDLTVPREALIAGHASPFEYLCHAFFEGGDCVVWANRGGGKTFLGAVATLLDVVFKPGIEVRILGGSLDQSKRMHAHLRALFEREPFASMVEGKATDTRLRLGNGSGVELLAQSQASVRGTRVQKLRCDEVELFDPEVWEAAQLVTRSKVVGEGAEQLEVLGSVEALSTMHRPYGLMREVVQSTESGERKLFKWGVVDVLGACGDERVCEGCELLDECGGRAKGERTPGHFSVADAIGQKRRVGAATWEAEMLCLRPTRTGTVLPEFGAAHVFETDPPEAFEGHWPWIGGMDFGYRGATVILWACVAPDGVVRVIDEHVAHGVVFGEHLSALRESPWPELAWIGVDPAGNQRNDQTGVSNATLLRSAGLTVRDRRIGLAEGIMLLRARLAGATGDRRLLVHRRCRRLIESLERYHYPDDNPRTLAPVKDGADHAVDALRYMVQNLDRPYSASRGRYA